MMLRSHEVAPAILTAAAAILCLTTLVVWADAAGQSRYSIKMAYDGYSLFVVPAGFAAAGILATGAFATWRIGGGRFPERRPPAAAKCLDCAMPQEMDVRFCIHCGTERIVRRGRTERDARRLS